MKSKEEELGKAMKRKAINRAKDEESAEEIKEYVFDKRAEEALDELARIDQELFPEHYK